MAITVCSRIMNEGANGLLFWKSPVEEFRSGSQLIVRENEVALFEKDGRIVANYTGGRYTLSTNNYIGIDKLRSFFTGGENVFTCRVYFLSLSDAMQLGWGTPEPVQVFQSRTSVQTSVRGRGKYTIRIAEPKTFLLKALGSNAVAIDQEWIVGQIRSQITQEISSLLGNLISDSDQHISVLLRDPKSIAKQMIQPVSEYLSRYGIELVDFFVENLSIPEDDPWYKAMAAGMAAHADSMQMKILGDNWQRVQGRDIMMSMANNQGAAGATAGMGAGMGMGMAAGGAFGAVASSVFAPFAKPQTPTPTPPAAPSRFAPKATPTSECPQCHAKIMGGGKFCPECGAKLEIKQLFCAGCGKLLQQGAKFCPECGTKQD